MRFHVVGLPYEPQPQCAYHGKVIRFVEMMRARGHEVFHYEAPEYLWDAERRFDPDSVHWRAWNAVATLEIQANLEPQDFVCVIAGRCQQPLQFPNALTVEFGVGYGGTFADYRVFESYAWMHTVYGAQAPGGDPHAADGRNFDVVIPNYYDPAEFPLGDGSVLPTFGFVGRPIARKGLRVAQEACERIGADLYVAGEGQAEFTGYGQHFGVLARDEIAGFMGGLTALFVPTIYVEPFGGVAVEAMLCGTPVITTDFGAFTETVQHGRDGFRCRTLAEFVDAAQQASTLVRAAIRQRAVERWSMAEVGEQYEVYFERLLTLWDAGWYEMPKAGVPAMAN